MTNSNIRVRFAPSPTGPLHIGGVRTALYNFLFARKHGGTFILRIEDTDQGRLVEGAEEYIMESLKWCGIEVDEGVREGGKSGPYRQSDRKEIYREYADFLVEHGKAYFAFDTPEELESLRLDHEKRGDTFLYNAAVRGSLANSLTMSEAGWKSRIASGDPYVIRYMMPENEDISFTDIIRGDIVVNSGTLDDKVLFKSDGMPTYHLANIVDDHLMAITHVIRGEEWLPSLPLHIMLYRSFGWQSPAFAHLPLLLKPTGKGKLSKRDGDKMGFPVFPLYWNQGETARGYREDGYFPEAFVNMLALLGWNPGSEKEIFSMDELIEFFSLERVGRSGSRFDPEKARWFNRQYMLMKSDEELAPLFGAEIRARGFDAPPDKIMRLTGMVRERADFVKEMWEQADFFFIAPSEYDAGVVAKRWTAESHLQVQELIALLEGVDDFSSANTEGVVKAWIAEKGYNTGAILNIFRLLVVGASRGPHLFDITDWLGREETLKRLRSGLQRLTE